MGRLLIDSGTAETGGPIACIFVSHSNASCNTRRRSNQLHSDPGRIAVMVWSGSATPPPNCTRLWCSKYQQSTRKIFQEKLKCVTQAHTTGKLTRSSALIKSCTNNLSNLKPSFPHSALRLLSCCTPETVLPDGCMTQSRCSSLPFLLPRSTASDPSLTLPCSSPFSATALRFRVPSFHEGCDIVHETFSFKCGYTVITSLKAS